MKNWETVYQCECGEIYTNGVGIWDDIFFLRPELCYKCGAKKSKFKQLGVAYWKWTPTLLNWTKGEWIYRN